MIFYIVGFMGAGKSGIGRDAARRAGVEFMDTDKQVEQMHGMTVAEIFERVGERVFRKSEREILDRLAESDDDVIVATGGGMPCEGDNMEVMNATGKTVYLKLSPEKLLSRLKPGQARRPKLRGMDDGQLLEFIRDTMPQRELFYQRASMVIDCDWLSDDSICGYIVDYVERYRGEDIK